MTTPNPSMSVSPEPTKGEEAAQFDAVGEAYMAVMAEVTGALGTATIARTMELNPPLSRLILAVEARTRAEYIPLVEAAREYVDLWSEPLSQDTKDRIEQWRQMNVASDALAAALVQVPGQQQSDTDHG